MLIESKIWRRCSNGWWGTPKPIKMMALHTQAQVWNSQ
uniref:Uncharacterized protein n=1 Tax=Anguilla anguilla TaxID=7936 RepID=A0A0E9R9S7_ANGAN